MTSATSRRPQRGSRSFSDWSNASIDGYVQFGVLPRQWTWIGAPIIVASGLYIAWREQRLGLARRAGPVEAVADVDDN